MIQKGFNQENKLKILLKTDIQVKTSSKAQWFNRIVPLKNNLNFIYSEGGTYELYDMEKEEIILSGQLSDKIKFFLEIYTKVLLFHDPKDLKIKLLDLNINQINPRFAFKSSEKLDMKSEESSLEILIDKFRVFFLDCHERNVKYLISQDLEKYYSNNNVCHYMIRVLPIDYHFETTFDLNPICRYDYPNRIAQTELFNWQVDKETIAVYGQDNENNQSEILLIKPHLIENAFYIVHTQFECSYTTMNVSNWINPHQVAIWVNCNDGTTRPSIFTFDLRCYYDGFKWLPEPQFIVALERDEFINDEPQVFMDIYQFYLGSTYTIQIRQVGNDAKISMINYENVKKPSIVNEICVDSFWIDPAVDHSYIILYNDLSIENQIIKFSTLFPADARHELLQIIEKAKIIEKYGINNVEELFEFYQ